MERTHLVLLVVWGILMVPTLLWWQDSVAWVVWMSWYAIVATHWGAWQSARAESKAAQVKQEMHEGTAGGEQQGSKQPGKGGNTDEQG